MVCFHSGTKLSRAYLVVLTFDRVIVFQHTGDVYAFATAMPRGSRVCAIRGVMIRRASFVS